MNDSYSVPCVFPVKKQWDPPLRVRVPGSKSITNRALLLSVLADGASTLHGVLFSDDSRHFLQCVSELGFCVKADKEKRRVQVEGLGGRLPRTKASLYVGSAGTAARFLTALLGTAEGSFRLDASPQMRRRPMAPLLAVLRELGAEISFGGDEGCFPFTITGHGFQKRRLAVDISQSSQFLSALLIASVRSDRDIVIEPQGRHGMSYIAVTTNMMRQFGVPVEDPSGQDGRFRIPGGCRYRERDYRIEPDVSAACYFYALAPLLGCPVLVEDVHPDSMQGDIRFLQLLVQMGCRLEDTPDGILLSGPPDGVYPGVTADLSACSDQAITLAALAPFAQTPTTITGIGHIRYQESDRLAAIAAELSRMGVSCEERPDSITIRPGRPKPARIETYDDHRMAMGFSLVGLRAEGIVIDNPGCCRKTFEEYFDVLKQAVVCLRAT